MSLALLALSGSNLASSATTACETRPITARCATVYSGASVPWEFEGPLTQLTNANCPQITVLDGNSKTGMVQIVCKAGENKGVTGWINSDTLSCSAKNVAAYNPIPEDEHLAREGKCSTPMTLPFDIEGQTGDATTSAQSLGMRMIERAEARAAAYRNSVVADHAHFKSRYGQATDGELMAILKRAEEQLKHLSERATNIFGSDCVITEAEIKAKLPELEREQGERTCTLLTKTLELLKLMKDPEFHRYNAENDEDGKFNDEDITAAWRDVINNTDLTDPFGKPIPPNYFHLAVRSILFYGEPTRAAQLESRNKLQLIRPASEFRVLEQKLGLERGGDIYELHNGYVYGGRDNNPYSGGGIDCSSFIADLIVNGAGADGNEGSWLTTADLISLHNHVTSDGKAHVREPWNKYAACFEVVDLRAGQLPEPGDIAFTRRTDSGHAALIKSFDKVTGEVNTIEAQGGFENTTGATNRPIFEPLCIGMNEVNKTAGRAVRPDVQILRLSPNASCPMRWK